MKKTAKVTIKDKLGQIAHVSVTGVGGLDDAETLADWLKGHTDGKVVSYSYTETQGLSSDDDSFSEGSYDKVRQRLTLFYTDTGGGEEEEQVRFSIPAPRDEDLDTDQEATGDLAEDVKDLIASITTREGTDLRYNGSSLLSRGNKVKKTNLTGV